VQECTDIEPVYATDSTDLLAIALGGRLSIILMDMRSFGDLGIPLIQLLDRSLHTPVVAFIDGPDADPRLLLEAGAVEVLNVFAPAVELSARVRSALQRIERGGTANTIRIGGLSFNLLTEGLLVDGIQVHLTPTESAVFRVLAANRGSVVSDRELLQTVWGSEYVDAVEYLRVYIGYLRAKIDKKADPGSGDSAGGDSHPQSYIRRERGRGYRMEYVHRSQELGSAAG